MSAFLRTASRAVARPAIAARSFSTTAPRPVARITVVGNLADTPEIRASSTGREYLRYAVASNSGSRENRKTSWFNISSFVEGGQKDFIGSLPKGCVSFVYFCTPVLQRDKKFQENKKTDAAWQDSGLGRGRCEHLGVH
jgi:tRNA uridine 5-carboxymethylaminomethyl modification enzyme